MNSERFVQNNKSKNNNRFAPCKNITNYYLGNELTKEDYFETKVSQII